MTLGTVVEFDERRGLGVLATAEGERLTFHAVSISDGSRRISEGARVRFTLRPGNLGEWEAADLEPLAP